MSERISPQTSEITITPFNELVTELRRTLGGQKDLKALFDFVKSRMLLASGDRQVMAVQNAINQSGGEIYTGNVGTSETRTKLAAALLAEFRDLFPGKVEVSQSYIKYTSKSSGKSFILNFYTGRMEEVIVEKKDAGSLFKKIFSGKESK